jgi:pimeloyl-ACP methyl ester carboxylesterase
MQASNYLDDLGGLSPHRTVLRLDPRGIGGSEIPTDPTTYRCDRQVDDVEALRTHLDLDRIDLLGHSAGASLAVLYAARYPERVKRLVLVTPSPRPVAVDVTDLDRRQVAERRHGEPWYPNAYAAFERVWSGSGTDADWSAIEPFTCGRWDADVHEYLDRSARQKNQQAAAAYYADGATDPPATRASLRALAAPVLVIAGEYDVALPPHRAAEYAALFPRADLSVQPGAGHYPWIDDPDRFVATIQRFLR